MKLIGIAITPPLNLTTERAIENLAKDSGVAVGPLNTSNTRTRFQVMAEGEAGYDFLARLLDLPDHRLNVAIIPPLEVHR
jgi:hypothetical protein